MIKQIFRTAAVTMLISSSTAFAGVDFNCQIDTNESSDPFNTAIVSATISASNDPQYDLRIRMFNADGEQEDTAICVKDRAGKFDCFDREELTLEFIIPAFSGKGIHLSETEFSMSLTEIREDSENVGKSITFLCEKSRN